ncbi:MAG: phage tail tape measure protein [Dysgonamonadaceae bacterium]|jgi:TP901 family phage tail tape measure protein|nr:phage tail tape measure protein [Dysgonamonadaceae bacterium]
MSDTNRSIKITIDNSEVTGKLTVTTQKISELTAKLVELDAAGKKNSKEYARTEKQLNSYTAAQVKQKAAIAETKRVLENLSGTTYNQLITVKKQLQRELKNEVSGTESYKNKLEQLNRVSQQVVKINKEMTSSIGAQNNMWNMVKGSLATLGGNMLTNITNNIGSFFINIAKYGYKTIKEFEQANADLASILGTNRENIKFLTEDAKKLGATTEYSASQVTLLQTELAKLGFDPKQIIDMTEHVLRFATALDADLPSAATVSGAALRAFGLDSSETERVVSAMAAGANKSALDFNYLQTAMSTVAPVAKTFGFTIEDTVALLGALSNSGFDASTAATSTRNILLYLADANGKLAKALGKPVKSMDDLVPALVELRDKGVDLATTLELTDKRSVAAFNIFLDGAESLITLRDAVTDAGDELKRMQEERLNTVEGSTKLLQSAWEGLMLSFSSSSGVFKKAIDWLTSLVNELNIALKSIQQIKQEVQSDIEATNAKEALKSIEDLAKAYEKNGHTVQESRKKALEDYSANMSSTIEDQEKEINRLEGIIYTSPIEGAVKNAEKSVVYLKQRVQLLKSEMEAVQSQFKIDPAVTPPSNSDPKNDPKAEKAAEKLRKKIAKEQEKILEDAKSQINIETKAYNDRLKAAGLFGIELNKLNALQLQERLKLEKDYQDKLIQIAIDGEEIRFKNEKEKAGVSGDPKIFNKQQNQVLEILQAEHEANIQKIKDESVKKQKDTQDSYDAVVLSSLKTIQKAQLDSITTVENAKILALSSQAKTQKQYDEGLKAIEKESFIQRIVLQEQYINALKQITNPSKQQQEELTAAENTLLDLQTKANLKKLAEEEDFQQKRKVLREQYGLVSLNESFRNEMKLLQEQYAKKLLSEDEFQKSKLQIQLGYVSEYAQQASNFIQAGANTVQAIEEAETANLDAEYTQRQSNLREQYEQGIISEEEYNQQKEQLDYQQKVKELDIQKKYADANFAMQVAQIIATTAQGVIAAWASSMSLGPIAGPIAAGALTTLLGITSVAQIDKAKAERDRVKAMTIEAPGGDGGSPTTSPTGQIVVKQAAKGKYDVVGQDDNRTYRNVPYAGEAYTGFVSSPTLVGERGKELIISSDDFNRLQRHINFPMVVNAINDAHNKRVPQRASGKYDDLPPTSPDKPSSYTPVFDNETAKRMLAILQRLEDGDITVQTNYGITELEAKQRQKVEAESKFTRK